MNVLFAESPKCFRKIAVRFLCLFFVTAIFSGGNISFLHTSDFAAHSQVFYQSEAQNVQKTDNIKIQTNEVRKKLWTISLNRKYRSGKIYFVKEGVAHVRMTKYLKGKPLKINVIEVNTKINPNVKIAPATAGSKLAKKAAILSISQKSNAFAAVNGSYFKPQTGVPLGILMIDKKLLTGPIYDRAALGIFEDGYKIDRVALNANINYLGKTLKVHNINQPRMLSTNVLVYTPDWGNISPKIPKYGINVVIQNGKITQKTYSQVQIPTNGFVISAPEKAVNEFFTTPTQNKKLFAKKQNTEITLDIKTNPDWDNVKHIIGGGPMLIKDGKIFVDYIDEKLKPIAGKNPRTAVGYTKDNNLVIVTVDGREETSVGAGLFEIAEIMRSFECEYAMNLDGGGSSVMQINGRIVNSPSVKGGIAISNALVLNCENTALTYAN